MENIIDKLRRIGLPLSIITEEQSKRIISATVRKISSLFDHYLIRVYKVEVTEDGSILNLVSHLCNQSTPSGAYSRIPLDSTKKKGALSWCIDKRTCFWVEDIRSAINKGDLKNKITDEAIGNEYIDFSFDPDSIISIPLMAKIQAVGVLSIQLPYSGKFNNPILHLLEDISCELARILRKAGEHESNINNTNQVVEDFLNEISDLEFQKHILKECCRTGFVARPFSTEYDKMGEAISRYFKEKKILARHFDPNLQGGLIINSIIEQIRGSHFCIADISGNNPNVLMEVGIMIAENKPIRILRRHDLDDQIPFNVGGYQIYRYRIQGISGKIQVAYPGEDKFKDFKLMVDGFLRELEQSSSFADAKPYVGE